MPSILPVPGLVPAPTAEAGPSYLLINWGPPLKPNGIVTGYMLYMNKVRLYMGGDTRYNVTKLQVSDESQIC